MTDPAPNAAPVVFASQNDFVTIDLPEDIIWSNNPSVHKHYSQYNPDGSYRSVYSLEAVSFIRRITPRTNYNRDLYIGDSCNYFGSFRYKIRYSSEDQFELVQRTKNPDGTIGEKLLPITWQKAFAMGYARSGTRSVILYKPPGSCVKEIRNPFIDAGEIFTFAQAVLLYLAPAMENPTVRENVLNEINLLLKTTTSVKEFYSYQMAESTSEIIRETLAKQLDALQQLKQPSPSQKAELLHLNAVQEIMNEQPTGSLGFMKAVSTTRSYPMIKGIETVYFGGRLDSTQAFFIGLPVEYDGGKTVPDLDHISAVPAVDTSLEQDWEALYEYWQKTGLLDIKRPSPHLKSVGRLKFGSRPVTIKTSGMSIHPKNVLERLQTGLDTIPEQPPFGASYLEKLAQYGIRDIVILPQQILNQKSRAQGASHAKEARRLLASNPLKSRRLFRQAASDFSAEPSGLYNAHEKRIYLSEDLFKNPQYMTDESIFVFLHEIAHADEAVRKLLGILSVKRLTAIDAAHAEHLVIDGNTVSNHLDVKYRTPNAPPEQRADALVYYWTRPRELAEIDPHLFNYFKTLTRIYETHKWREKKTGNPVEGQRLRIPKNPFDRKSGNLSPWAAEHPREPISTTACLDSAGRKEAWATEINQNCRIDTPPKK